MPNVAPRVTVIVTSYNQEQWIAQAVESVLSQETSFAFEIVVGDNASHDNSRGIAERLAAAHASRVRVLPPGPHVDMHERLQDCLRAARGEYVAILNGDDYWTSPRKMQAQVNALDAHPGWSMCFHPVQIVNDAGEVVNARSGPGARATFSTRDLLRSNVVPSCAAMFRGRLVADLPAWFGSTMMGDWTLWLLLSRQGPAGFLNDVMAAYRVQRAGSWTGRTERDRLTEQIRYLTFVATWLEGPYGGVINRSLSDRYVRLGLEFARSGERAPARDAFRQAVARNRWNLSGWRRLARVARP